MKVVPTKAIVLAAGLGTRMRPLTNAVPKPLLPLWGRPLLLRTLETLRGWGVREALINLHHQPEAIRAAIDAAPVPGLHVEYSHEPVILGTGGVLVRGREFLSDDPFWMVNADIAFHLDPAPLLLRFARVRPLAACWIHGERGPRTVEATRGWIRSFRSAHPQTPGTYTFCGLQLIDPRILDFLPREERFISIVDAYEAGLRAGERIAGVEVPGAWWADLGTPAQYLQAHAESAPRRGRAWIAKGRGVAIEPGARVANSVLWEDVTVARGAEVRDAIIGAGCLIRGAASGIVMRAQDALDAVELRLLRRAGWSADALARPLGPRGSARSFTRLASGRRSAMLIRYDDTRPENALYASHARFLAAAGFPVPRVLADDRRGCATLLEDLGDDSIQATLRGATARRLRPVYTRVLDALLLLHGAASERARRRDLAMVPAFRPRLYRWEREYFAEHMLLKRLAAEPAEITAILRELQGIGRKLLRAPAVVVHRDLQSSNILLRRGRPWFIDFQGMRWGAAAYDLASLLADPYMELDEELQLALLDYYAARCADPASVRALFWPAVVQRLAQAQGAFAKLGSNRDTTAFAAHIAPAWRMMRRALDHLPGMPVLRARVAREAAIIQLPRPPPGCP